MNRKQAELKTAEIAGVKKEYVVMSKFSPVPFAEEILNNNQLVFDEHKCLWMYDKKEGIWKREADQIIKTLLRKELIGDEQQKRNYIDEIIAYIKDITFDPEFKMDDKLYLIPLKDKVFNLMSGEYQDFSPEHKLSSKLDIEIDEEIKECPLIDKFFEDCVGEKYKEMLYELMAYTLYRDVPYQKMFFIYGPGGTGKSIFMSLLERFLGKDNFCSVEPKQIQKDIHSTSLMEYKYANIVSDINYDDFENITQVKKLTGGDTISIRRLYQNPYNTKLFTKQIYSTNKLPVVKEKTNAWYRRVYLLEFSNIIPIEGRDLFLLSKLTVEKELKGLAYKCLEKLRQLYNEKFIFTWGIDEVKMREVYEEVSNPILMFINENCTENRDNFLFKWEFGERLNNWLKNNHFPILSKSEINTYMREKYSESNRPSFNGDKTYRVWSGLKWKEKGDTDQFNHFNHFNQVIKRVYVYKGYFPTPPKSVKMVKPELESQRGIK